MAVPRLEGFDVFEKKTGLKMNIVEYSLGSQHFRAVFGGKCARNQTVDMKWIKIASEYCDLALISSLEQKTSNIQCKI